MLRWECYCERVRMCGVVHICTISFWRFKNISQNDSVRVFFFFSSFNSTFITLSLVSSRLVSYRIALHMLVLCACCIFHSLFRIYIFCSILFLFSWLHTHNGMFTQCLRSSRSFFVRFVSFYVLNIALISFRCGFSLFNISPVCSVAAAGFFHNFVSFICVRARVANIVISAQLLRLTFSMFFA